MNIPESAKKWLKDGERGISSEQIFSTLTGLDILDSRHEWSGTHPCDPSDLMRCRKLLNAVPEFERRFTEMKSVSPVWSRFVDEWNRLCSLMDEEAPDWEIGTGSAPKTYELMMKIRMGRYQQT